MTEVELRTDNVLTSAPAAGYASPKDAMELHDWVSEAPEKSEPIRVAIMDSGVHPKLQMHSWGENIDIVHYADYTGNSKKGDAVGHGSACASIVGVAAANVLSKFTDSTPIEIESHRIFGESGRTDFNTIKRAYRGIIERSDEIDIVNMSWGARQDIPRINRLHEKLMNEGVHDVVAAGNTGSDGGSPATAKGAFSVGAVDKHGDVTRFTSRDPNQGNPDVAALGKNTKLWRAPGTSMGTPINDEFTKASGTSFAAPYTTAGYAIALWFKQSSWDTKLEEAAPDIPGTKVDGEGLLKLDNAITGEEPKPIQPEGNARVLSLFGNSAVWMNNSWLPSGKTGTKLLNEDENGIDIRFKK